MEKFDLKQTLAWTFKNKETYSNISFENFFTNLVYMIAFFILYEIVRYPIEKYYDWEDPLTEEAVGIDETNSEATLRKMKYRQKVPGWQEKYV